MYRHSQVLLFGILMCLSFAINAQEYGIASYYADDFQGKETASGEKYDKNKLTGAHKTLEYGTIIKVTRLDNKKSVQVRINDRGPFIKGRVVEVSKKAAEALDLVTAGTTQVKVEVVGKGKVTSPPVAPPVVVNKPKPADKAEVYADEIVDPRVTEKPKTTTPKPETPKEAIEEAKEDIVEEQKTEDDPADVVIITTTPKEDLDVEVVTIPPTSQTEPRVNQPKEESARLVKGQDYKQYDLYKIQLLRPKKQGFGVQVASLNDHDNMLKQVANLQEKYFKNILVSIEKGSGTNSVYKIILGPFPDMRTANSYKTKLKNRYKIKGFVVNLANGSY